MRLSCEVIRESCEVTRKSFGAFIFTFQRRVLGPITASVGVEVTLTRQSLEEFVMCFPKRTISVVRSDLTLGSRSGTGACLESTSSCREQPRELR